mmetsp:Transcript_27150/g.53333  ORF Transcript_27150/g.53333 Transcript_27150/m.53333 type:complete len:220 (-) Transcript_27150:569-1228(-)
MRPLLLPLSFLGLLGSLSDGFSLLRRRDRIPSPRSKLCMRIKTGDLIPETPIATDSGSFTAKSLFEGDGRNGVLISVSSPLDTPANAQKAKEVAQHVKNFVKKDHFFAFVAQEPLDSMKAWSKAQGIDGKILMISDKDGSFVKDMGLEENPDWGVICWSPGRVKGVNLGSDATAEEIVERTKRLWMVGLHTANSNSEFSGLSSEYVPLSYFGLGNDPSD